MSDTRYGDKNYTANSGYIEFRGDITFRVPMSFPAMYSSGGINIRLLEGELWLTFPYSVPLPIVSDNFDAHWARFHWEVFQSFRWMDSNLDGHARGVWDTRLSIDDSEDVVGSGFNGYHVTSSLD